MKIFLFISNTLRKKAVQELIKYGLVGVVGLVIDVGIYYLLFDKCGVYYLVASVIGSTLAIINNFVLNSYFTFKVTNNKLKRFISFAGIAGVGMLLQTGLLALFVSVFSMNEMVGKIIAIVIVAAIQFIVNKFFTFKQK